MKKKFERALELEDFLRYTYLLNEDRRAALEEYADLREYFMVREGDKFSNYYWHDFNGPMRKI